MFEREFMNLSLLSKRFLKAAQSYNDNAIVQKKMADVLFDNFLKINKNEFRNVLEIGCGTGFVTDKILNELKFDKLLINDIVDEYCNLHVKKSEKIEKIIGDITNIIENIEKVDLVLSNATFQWIEYKNIFFEQLAKKLTADGILAFSTFGPENFKEIKNTFGIGLEYLNDEEYLKLLENNFEIIYHNSYIEKLNFNSFIELLKHMKLTGVNSIKHFVLNNYKISHYQQKYIENNNTNSYILTYNPIIIIGKKKK
jgi:malonyl-ACP O-methyltransferase BioC